MPPSGSVKGDVPGKAWAFSCQHLCYRRYTHDLSFNNLVRTSDLPMCPPPIKLIEIQGILQFLKDVHHLFSTWNPHDLKRTIRNRCQVSLQSHGFWRRTTRPSPPAQRWDANWNSHGPWFTGSTSGENMDVKIYIHKLMMGNQRFWIWVIFEG